MQEEETEEPESVADEPAKEEVREPEQETKEPEEEAEEPEEEADEPEEKADEPPADDAEVGENITNELKGMMEDMMEAKKAAEEEAGTGKEVPCCRLLLATCLTHLAYLGCALWLDWQNIGLSRTCSCQFLSCDSSLP